MSSTHTQMTSMLINGVIVKDWEVKVASAAMMATAKQVKIAKMFGIDVSRMTRSQAFDVIAKHKRGY